MGDFSRLLEAWYRERGRCDLPWRQVDDPYLIWISEVILQQTRIAQGYDYYHRFTERFPDVFSLAAADEDEVLKLWQGLGYYSRARNLHAAAREVARAGRFPSSYEEIRRLKGVGDYTAAAICAFAYRQPRAVVDGNVYRVLSRIFGIDTPIDTTEGRKTFAALADELLDRSDPHLHNSAIMDFGALQCVPKSPDCEGCPFVERCVAHEQGAVQDFPVKAKKTAVRNRYLVYVFLEDDRQMLLHRRDGDDIWRGLYEPCLMEFATPPDDFEVLSRLRETFGEEGCLARLSHRRKHQLTHRLLWVDGYRLRVNALPKVEGCVAVAKSDLPSYALPKIVADLLALSLAQE